MIGRILAVAIGLFTGLAGAQMPEFAQQYRQRLGGAIDELRRIVTRFDESARESNMTREQALRRFTADPDPLVRRQGEGTEAVIARLDSLQRQRQLYETAGPFGRLLIFVREADPGLARATYLDYEPAWPATSEGLIAGGTGFAVGWALLLFLSATARRLMPGRRRGVRLRTA